MAQPLTSNLHISEPHDQYAYRVPNPKHMPKYTKAKVLCTQDKQHISWAAWQNYATAAAAL